MADIVHALHHVPQNVLVSMHIVENLGRTSTVVIEDLCTQKYR